MAAAIIPFLIAGAGAAAGTTIASSIAKKKEAKATAQAPVSTGLAAAEAKTAAEQQAEGVKKSKQAATFLKDRNAKGFGSNPNVAKPFLLAL